MMPLLMNGSWDNATWPSVSFRVVDYVRGCNLIQSFLIHHYLIIIYKLLYLWHYVQDFCHCFIGRNPKNTSSEKSERYFMGPFWWIYPILSYPGSTQYLQALNWTDNLNYAWATEWNIVNKKYCHKITVWLRSMGQDLVFNISIPRLQIIYLRKKAGRTNLKKHKILIDYTNISERCKRWNHLFTKFRCGFLLLVVYDQLLNKDFLSDIEIRLKPIAFGTGTLFKFSQYI